MHWRTIIELEKAGYLNLQQYLEEIITERNGLDQTILKIYEFSKSDEDLFVLILHSLLIEFNKLYQFQKDQDLSHCSTIEQIFSKLLIVDWEKLTKSTDILMETVKQFFCFHSYF